jgi:hypothetical protein
MNELGVGKLITGEAERDAIHVAVAPVTADEDLWPGDWVRLRYGSTELAYRDNYNDQAIGVVDPFLEKHHRINKGQRFWLFLFPGTVVGMRHHWAHLVFDSPAEPQNEHEAWLRRFAEEWGFNFDDLISTASESNEDGMSYVTARGSELYGAGELGEDYEWFWYHLERYTGKHFSPSHRQNLGWSCTC